jgi:hypothetical protein
LEIQEKRRRVVVRKNPEQHLPEIWSLRAVLPGTIVIEGLC